jgi:hypothetical protein
MANDNVLDRVRKLLELGHSDNINESANAMGHAQRLMAKHNISEAMLAIEADDGDDDEAVEDDLLYSDGVNKLPTWKNWLAGEMADLQQCRVYSTHDGRRGGQARLHIVGRPSDATTLRYLFSYITREINRLANSEAELLGSPGRTWFNNFRLGAVGVIVKRLQEANKEARVELKREANDGDTLGNGTALVLVNTAIAKIESRKADADAFCKDNLNLRTTSGSRSNYDPGGRSAGARAGAGININGGGPSLGSGNSKRLRS